MAPRRSWHRFAAARLRLRGDRLPGPDRGGEPRSTFRIMPYYYCITNFVATVFLTIEAAQHGHRDMVLTSATINRRRMVATELGM